jgi:Ni,Fe-hydrogenase maturation factor
MENKATGLLVVGYGNPFNSDDGAGWSAAVELEALSLIHISEPTRPY